MIQSLFPGGGNCFGERGFGGIHGVPAAGRTSAACFPVYSSLATASGMGSCRRRIRAAAPGQEQELLELQQGEAPHRGCELDLACREEREGLSWEERGKCSAGTLRVPPSSWAPNRCYQSLPSALLCGCRCSLSRTSPTPQVLTPGASTSIPGLVEVEKSVTSCLATHLLSSDQSISTTG